MEIYGIICIGIKICMTWNCKRVTTWYSLYQIQQHGRVCLVVVVFLKLELEVDEVQEKGKREEGRTKTLFLSCFQRLLLRVADPFRTPNPLPIFSIAGDLAGPLL